MFPPAALVLLGLFGDPTMFDSDDDWRKAGFNVLVGKGRKSDIMVASHPSMPGYLFKKYSKKVSLKEQLENYRRRIEGADKLREFIAAQRLTRIAVPRKHLHELPPAFARKGVPAYVLVVEHMPLLTKTVSKQKYREMDNESLRQICTVLFAFQSLDSGSRNLPFTDRGQIAFIDTERWSADDKKKIPLRHFREYLTGDQQAFVEAFCQSATAAAALAAAPVAQAAPVVPGPPAPPNKAP
jgi:hypothetical protein